MRFVSGSFAWLEAKRAILGALSRGVKPLATVAASCIRAGVQ